MWHFAIKWTAYDLLSQFLNTPFRFSTFRYTFCLFCSGTEIITCYKFRSIFVPFYVEISVLKSSLGKDDVHTVQRLMLSKGAKWTKFYNITVILHYCWDKTIARSGYMHRDDSGIFSLAIKCFGNINTSVQNFVIQISSVKTVPKCLQKLKVFEQI